MLKFTLKYLIFAPTCFGPHGPSSGSSSSKHVGAFAGKKELWRYQDTRYNNKKNYITSSVYDCTVEDVEYGPICV